jgi:dTDP-4-dehydrorhamnose 3,5-epimerase
MGGMKVMRTPMSGLTVIATDRAADGRGAFERLFCEREWEPVRAGLHFVQVNLSTTVQRGTVRGLHYQSAPAAEAKLIRCVRGRAFDVSVDLRAGSPTFLQWHGVELSADNPREIFIPEGFAHGFQALEDDTQLLYFHTAPWTAQCEGGVRHDDPRVGIHWPLPVINVSPRDQGHPLLDTTFTGLTP